MSSSFSENSYCPIVCPLLRNRLFQVLCIPFLSPFLPSLNACAPVIATSGDFAVGTLFRLKKVPDCSFRHSVVRFERSCVCLPDERIEAHSPLCHFFRSSSNWSYYYTGIRTRGATTTKPIGKFLRN